MGVWEREIGLLGGPGDDLLFRALGRSTIGAEGFHGRVRDGIGCIAPRHSRQAIKAPEIWVDDGLWFGVNVLGLEYFLIYEGFVATCDGISGLC